MLEEQKEPPTQGGAIRPIRSFEDCLPEIEIIIENKRKDWTFKASVMCDFDDVKSVIMVHIWRKWYLYNQDKPLGGWVATIVKHQFHNILRDSYRDNLFSINLFMDVYSHSF